MNSTTGVRNHSRYKITNFFEKSCPKIWKESKKCLTSQRN